MKCLITTSTGLYLHSVGGPGSEGEPARHQREACRGIWSSATGVTCDYRGKGLNEHTITGPSTAALRRAGESQSTVRLISAACLGFSGADQGFACLAGEGGFKKNY